MKNIAVIPARGGSKRIPRKNIKEFRGAPIIKYSIEAALASGCFAEVMVSTDDHEIAEVAMSFGAKVPFFRSEKAASDQAPTDLVIKEVIREYQKRNSEFDFICCIYPASPLISGSKIRGGLELLQSSGAEALMPVVEFSYPVQRAVKIEGNLIAKCSDADFSKRSQDCPKLYHDAGQFYWIRTEAFLRVGSLLTGSTIPLILTELEAQDIDTEADWRLAEMKYILNMGKPFRRSK